MWQFINQSVGWDVYWIDVLDYKPLFQISIDKLSLTFALDLDKDHLAEDMSH